jgi:hypothetical protein
MTKKNLKIKISSFKEKGIKLLFSLSGEKTKLFSPLKKRD